MLNHSVPLAQGYGRLGGLGEVDARALWSRQNMPADVFMHVWTLSDLDGNRLLSKSEFCLFMYLMHALRNFGSSFRLPEYITPEQATRLLGLEGAVGAQGESGFESALQFCGDMAKLVYCYAHVIILCTLQYCTDYSISETCLIPCVVTKDEMGFTDITLVLSVPPCPAPSVMCTTM